MPASINEIEQAKYNALLRDAVNDHDVQGVIDAIREGADPNNDFYDPLCWASAHGDLAIMRVLLEHGANPFVTDFNGGTPLMKALQYDQPRAVDFLLQRYPDYPLHSEHTCAMLQTVNRSYKEEMLIRLLDAGDDPHLPVPHDTRHFSCFDLATQQGWSDALYLMNQYARADLPLVSTLNYEDVALPNKAFLQHPLGWRQFSLITAKLEAEGTPLTKADLTREFSDGRSYLRRAAECYRLGEAMAYLNSRGETITLTDLLDEKGKPNALLSACIERQALPALLTMDNWKDQPQNDMRQLLAAIPPQERAQINNIHGLMAIMPSGGTQLTR